jgi:hypothetical protein
VGLRGQVGPINPLENPLQNRFSAEILQTSGSRETNAYSRLSQLVPDLATSFPHSDSFVFGGIEQPNRTGQSHYTISHPRGCREAPLRLTPHT